MAQGLFQLNESELNSESLERDLSNGCSYLGDAIICQFQPTIAHGPSKLLSQPNLDLNTSFEKRLFSKLSEIKVMAIELHYCTYTHCYVRIMCSHSVHIFSPLLIAEQTSYVITCMASHNYVLCSVLINYLDS